ncbi:hypothetical protein QDR37_02895 [Amnibacterium sp. CER49]|uniref:hypothetical protein n=1 Tax=Amnibacterium sp. CER49 TaxID=3039161 RepID=UPI002447AE4A|nr:hypothetical protein [Amnibacterium sp. CER49]MDH2442885.1 hypothetical protein [Amnibacterium sp. CER49]
MREAFAVEAEAELGEGADVRALGGAVTVALCGALEHPGPCPLAPHRTTTEPAGAVVRARVVLAAEADRRDEAVDRVRRALAVGRFTDPEGAEQRWRLLACRPVPLREAEQALAARLVSLP